MFELVQIFAIASLNVSLALVKIRIVPKATLRRWLQGLEDG